MQDSYSSSVADLLVLGHELGGDPARKFDLHHVRTLLAALGEPQRRFPAVLVAGTNGKGSTAATLASILRAAGHRTGLFTSPHLAKINDRIALNGEATSDEEFAEVHTRVEQAANELVANSALPWHPSFFEMLTAMAFEYFAKVQVDIAVLEVGMGGRLDATNTARPLLSLITDIALDHQKFLGNTIAEIAVEKAGIIRPGGILVTLPQHPQANEVIGKMCIARQARAVSAAKFVPPVSPGADKMGSGLVPGGPAPQTSYSLSVMGEEIRVKSPLVGRHQLRNIAIAIAAAEELNRLGFLITAAQVAQGVEATRWPARFQYVPATGNLPEMILDVAHNPAGAWALRSTLAEYCSERRLTILFGAMRDKAVAEIVEILFPIADRVIATQAQHPRAAKPEEIRAAAVRTGSEVMCVPSVGLALEMLEAENKPNASLTGGATHSPADLLVITGSIYLVGEALEAIARRNRPHPLLRP